MQKYIKDQLEPNEFVVQLSSWNGWRNERQRPCFGAYIKEFTYEDDVTYTITKMWCINLDHFDSIKDLIKEVGKQVILSESVLEVYDYSIE